MQGKIIKGIAGSYEVYTEACGILECSPRGILRREGVRPLPGDEVEVQLLEGEAHTGVIDKILPRRNALVRPAVANVDQALVIFAVTAPKPNFHLLDSFLLSMEEQHINTVICFNKLDAASGRERERCSEIYAQTGYRVLFTSAKTGEGLDDVYTCLTGKTTTVAGPSGVGKSSIINRLQHDTQMETGEISKRIGRGKHTTRHSQLIWVAANTFIMDTPGFSSLAAPLVEAEEVAKLFPEFAAYEPYCRFQGCIHLKEPDCGVKEAVSKGKISGTRYEDYALIVEEIRSRRKY